MMALKTAIWVLLGIIHLAVVVRAILLDGRDSYSRAAWLLLLIALPGIATVLYLLFGEPWISAKFRKRSRDAYEALLADVRPEGGEAVGSPESANAFACSY
jgi:cardiolipin synthase